MRNTNLVGLIAVLTLSGCSSEHRTQYHDGDIIFQTSKSSQSQAIQVATHSKYSHMGVLSSKVVVGTYTRPLARLSQLF